MADPASLDKPKKPKFQWLGDPAANVRGKGRARITGDDTKAMLDYNKDLIAPMDRGGGQNIRVNGQPERFAGDAPRATVRPTTFQPLNASGLAKIRNTQRDSQGNPIGVINPSLNPDRPATVDYAGNSSTLYTPETDQPRVVNEQDPRAEFFDSVRDPAAPINPSNVAPAAIPPTNPAFTGASGAAGAGAERLTGQDNFGKTGEELGGGGPGAPVTNPLTGAAAKLQNWQNDGGSVATFHQSQVEKGLRAPIDAHAPPDPQGSTASAEIRASHGWGATNEGDAVQIGKQMTKEFNANNAPAQKAWNDKFADAHANLMKTLSADH